MSIKVMHQSHAHAERTRLVVRALLLEQWLRHWHETAPVTPGQEIPEGVKIRSARQAHEATLELEGILDKLDGRGIAVPIAA